MGERNPNTTDWTRPIRRAVVKTASPTLFDECRAVYLGTGGDLTVTFIDGTSVELNNMVAGVWHPLAVVAITVIDNSAADVRVGY